MFKVTAEEVQKITPIRSVEPSSKYNPKDKDFQGELNKATTEDSFTHFIYDGMEDFKVAGINFSKFNPNSAEIELSNGIINLKPVDPKSMKIIFYTGDSKRDLTGFVLKFEISMYSYHKIFFYREGTDKFISIINLIRSEK